MDETMKTQDVEGGFRADRLTTKSSNRINVRRDLKTNQQEIEKAGKPVHGIV